MLQVGSPYHLYMMESEGMVDQVNTRRAKLKAAARDVRALQPETAEEFYEILANYGIDACTLTNAERSLFN